jgi:hypothetical protein
MWLNNLNIGYFTFVGWTHKLLWPCICHIIIPQNITEHNTLSIFNEISRWTEQFCQQECETVVDLMWLDLSVLDWFGMKRPQGLLFCLYVWIRAEYGNSRKYAWDYYNVGSFPRDYSR